MNDTVEEVAEISETNLAIRSAFYVKQGGDEEVVKMAMLQAGCKIKSVTRMYNQFMIDSGLLASKEDKDSALETHLADMDLTDEDTFSSAIEKIVESVTGSTEASAASMIRSYCRREEIECWKKPVGERRTGFRFKFYSDLISNPKMDEKEVKTLCDEFGSDNDKKAVSHYQAIREMANKIAESYA